MHCRDTSCNFQTFTCASGNICTWHCTGYASCLRTVFICEAGAQCTALCVKNFTCIGVAYFTVKNGVTAPFNKSLPDPPPQPHNASRVVCADHFSCWKIAANDMFSVEFPEFDITPYNFSIIQNSSKNYFPMELYCDNPTSCGRVKISATEVTFTCVTCYELGTKMSGKKKSETKYRRKTRNRENLSFFFN